MGAAAACIAGADPGGRPCSSEPWHFRMERGLGLPFARERQRPHGVTVSTNIIAPAAKSPSLVSEQVDEIMRIS